MATPAFARGRDIEGPAGQDVVMGPGVIRCAPDDLDLDTVGVGGVDRQVHALVDRAAQRHRSGGRTRTRRRRPRRAAMKRTFGALSPSQRTQLAELLAILTASMRDPG